MGQSALPLTYPLVGYVEGLEQSVANQLWLIRQLDRLLITLGIHWWQLKLTLAVQTSRPVRKRYAKKGMCGRGFHTSVVELIFATIMTTRQWYS